MCRIHGHVNAGLTLHQLRTLGALQHHGGPDERTVEHGPRWALGNNRLAIVALDDGDQPFRLGDHILAVYNGEIYNHRELRKLLEDEGYRIADNCDGAILPALYHRYGDSFLDHLDGMYAIALLDLRQGTPRLLLATDPAGMKPIYYHLERDRSGIAFASEIPALLALPAVSPTADVDGLEEYLATKTPFGEQTMLRDVRVLPPGAVAVFTPGSAPRIARKPTAAGLDDDNGESVQDAGGRIRRLLRAEVHRLTQADVPVCAITSGGLDSSLITQLLTESVDGLHSFNIAYTGNWPFDERHFAAEVARRAGTVHHQVEADPADFPALLADVAWHLGQPNADPITLSTYVLFQAVHRAGFKVAVTGDAADELFSGYERIVRAVTDGPGWARRYVDALAAVPWSVREQLYTADYRHHVLDRGRTDDRLVAQLDPQTAQSPQHRLTRLTEFELTHRLPAYHLRRVDHLSMASSVEVRLPFCQPAVVRLGRALAAPLRVGAGRGKLALYAAAEGLLPDEVLHRPKQPFTLPVTAMLRPGQPLYDHAREVLTAPELASAGQLDPAAVGRLLRRQAERPDDTTALAVWSLMIHQIWRNVFGVRRADRTSRIPEAVA